ncbi:MAG: C25 family cysteine peptidase, partial [Actinomycetota bacterium]|nr:C25 family cysteine peptidase [Actinomycetota bacterium]
MKKKMITRKALSLCAFVVAFFMLVCTFSLVIPASAGVQSPTSLTLSFDFPELEVKRGADGTVSLYMEGWPPESKPGLPCLPSKILSIALPPGMKAREVTRISSEWQTVSGTNLVEWGQPPASSAEPPARVSANRGVYDSDSPYPAESISLEGNGMMRQYSIAKIKITPVQYLPKRGVLKRCLSLKLVVKCASLEEDKRAYELLGESPDSLAAEVIDNFEQASPWYESEAGSGEKSLALAPSGSGDIADYLIVAPDSLTSAVAPLKTYKESQGLSVLTRSTSWIESNSSGVDFQEKLRNYLKENYASLGIDYVLLVGTDSSLPMRRCYTPVGESDDYTPTDYYYSDLSGDWDLNDDGEYGQFGVDDEDGGVDFYPEVSVGRIPVDDAAEVTSICDKIVSFSQDEGEWKGKALLLGAILNFKNEDNILFYPATFGSALMEEIKTGITIPAGCSNTTMYEKEGLKPDLTPCDQELTRDNVLSEFPNGYGMVTWNAHGSREGAWRKWWSSDDDGDGVADSSEMSWEAFIESSDTALFDDIHPGIVFACACDNAYPENSNNLGAALMKKGASAFVGASRVSWYTPGWKTKDSGGNASLDYFFFHYLVNESYSVGEALRLSDIQYKEHYCGWRGKSYANLYGFNLFGDPSMKLG